MRVLLLIGLALVLGLSPSLFGAMVIQSLSGGVTGTEVSSYKTFMAGRTPPTANTYDNNMADGTAGMDCESLGLMYEVTNDPALLNQMITFADAFLALRNDYTDQRVMWTGNVEPVWLTKPTGTSAGYAGCENNEIAGHIAYCAKLILLSPALWNTPVPDGNPHGFGATYWQRAKTYVAQIDQVEDNYMTPWFIDPATKRLKDSTAVAPAFAAFGQSTTAWNRQMMFLHGWQTLADCHAILGDNPAKVALYDQIVAASVGWFQSEWQTTTAGGQTCYVWQYAPGHAGGNEEMNGHAAWDMWGLSRAFVAGKYGLTQPLLRPFAEALRYTIYQAGTTYTFAEWVNGDTSSTRSYIYSQWLPVAAYDPQIFATMANADIAQGSQGSNPIYDAQILWVKNARARGVFPSNTDSQDFSLSTPWIETVAAGGNVVGTVTLNPLTSFTNTVILSATRLPKGIAVSFNPPAITNGSGVSTFVLTASNSAAGGVYALTNAMLITGISGVGTRSAPVTVTVKPRPVIIGATRAGANFVINGTNGFAGATFNLLGSTNLALPLNQWTPLATNTFGTNGDFSVTNKTSAVAPNQFYLLQY